MLLDNAQDLVARDIPKPTEAEREEALLRGIDREIGLGWCEIQNAGSYKEDVDLIKKAFDAGKIKIRFVNAVFGPGPDAQNFSARRTNDQCFQPSFHAAHNQSHLRRCARSARRGAPQTI